MALPMKNAQLFTSWAFFVWRKALKQGSLPSLWWGCHPQAGHNPDHLAFGKTVLGSNFASRFVGPIVSSDACVAHSQQGALGLGQLEVLLATVLLAEL